MNFIKETSVNPNTGEEQTTTSFSAELISIADKPQNNSNGKPFYPATVEFKNGAGKLIQRGALVYEGNYSHTSLKNGTMEVGTSYRCRALQDSRGVLITVSHLTGAPRASEDDFGFDAISNTAAVKTSEPALADNI